MPANLVATVSQTLSLSSGWLITALVACVDSQFLRDGYSHQGKGHPHWHQLKHLLVLSAEWLKIDQGLTLHLLEVVFLVRYYLLSFYIFEAVLPILWQPFQSCPIIATCLTFLWTRDSVSSRIFWGDAGRIMMEEKSFDVLVGVVWGI